jgi:hypothetical protein
MSSDKNRSAGFFRSGLMDKPASATPVLLSQRDSSKWVAQSNLQNSGVSTKGCGMDLLAPVTVAFGGEGWWGILLFVPLLLAGHVSEVAVGYGLWRRWSERPPSPRVWRVAAVSGAVAVVSLIAALVWVAVYAAPRLAADLATLF